MKTLIKILEEENIFLNKKVDNLVKLKEKLYTRLSITLSILELVETRPIAISDIVGCPIPWKTFMSNKQ